MGPGQTRHKFQAWAPPELLPKLGPIRAVRTESVWVAQCERGGALPNSQCQPSTPGGSPHLFQIQLKPSGVPVLGSEKELEDQWRQPRTPLQTRGSGIFLEPELVSCKTLRARQREESRFLWGSVVYTSVFGLRRPKWPCKGLVTRD